MRRKDFFYHEHVLPVVPKIVVVGKLRAFSRHYVAQFGLAFVSRLRWFSTVLIGYPIMLTLDDELMEVRIFPAHNALHDSVELGER